MYLSLVLVLSEDHGGSGDRNRKRVKNKTPAMSVLNEQPATAAATVDGLDAGILLARGSGANFRISGSPS